MQSYRNDIDGLRAICIGAVVMFHAGFDDWKGGYIGVDVFFVISGYLITSMIARDMAEGRFSFLSFYERRARRLLAATIPMVIFTTLFAWAFYTTSNFLAYAKSLVAFAAYVSNWYFLATTGYFGTDANVTPLLHTWSLAVEEQFYFVFPVLLMLLSRRKALVVPALALIAVLSVSYAQAEIALGNHDRAFYSLFSRFWELMAGALLALKAQDVEKLARFSTPMRAVGLALVITPIFTFGPTTSVPGFATLIPVSGALLLLAASPTVRDPFVKVLEASPVTYLGRISYSLYLWHWPIFGAVNTLFLDRNDLHAVLGIAASIGAASLSYHYLEHPIRKRRLLPRKIDMAGLVAASLAASIAVGAYGWSTGGWPGRFSPEVESTAALAAKRPADPDNCFKTPEETNDFCKINVKPGEPVDLLLWGDSHAGSLIPAFRQYAEANGLSFAATARADCLPLVGVWRTKDDINKVCRKFNDEALAFINEHEVKNVAITARWQVYTTGPQILLDDAHKTAVKSQVKTVFRDGVARTLDALAGKNIMIIEQMPELHGELPAAYLLMQRIGLPPSTVAATLKDHRKKNRTSTEAFTSLEQSHRFGRFDPATVFCANELCSFEAGGKLLYFDDDHLNTEGGQFIYPALAAALDKWRVK